MNGPVRTRILWMLLTVLLAGSLAALPGCEEVGGQNGGGQDRDGGATDATGQPVPGEGSDSVASAAERVLPSVVNVSTTQEGQQGLVPEGVGSGIIIREDGYILTNNHVIGDADTVLVSTGAQDFDAEVVGRDPQTDLAVLRIDREGLDPAEMGEPGDLEVGEWVIAVGSPFGLEKTVTAGIVSGLERSTVRPTRETVTAYTNLIQTDASINPGNSGGALADLSGRVVGVNTLIEAQVRQSAGIGFAIPIDFAMNVAEQLIEDGEVEHPFLGVGIISVTPHVADQLDLQVEEGALVQSVEEGSPAAEADLQEGDVITRIGDDEVTQAADVFTAVRSRRPGDTVEVEFSRDGESDTVEVELAGRTGGVDQQQSPPEGTPEQDREGMPNPHENIPSPGQ